MVIWNYNMANVNELHSQLLSMIWGSIFLSQDLDLCAFVNAVLPVAPNFFPFKVFFCDDEDMTGWINVGLKRAIKRKRRVYLKCVIRGCKLEYKLYVIHVQSETKALPYRGEISIS